MFALALLLFIPAPVRAAGGEALKELQGLSADAIAAAPAPQAVAQTTLEQLDGAVAGARRFLLRHQARSGPYIGSWGGTNANFIGGSLVLTNPRFRVPITAMTLLALEKSSGAPADRAIRAGAAWLLENQPEDGYDYGVLGGNNMAPFVLGYGLEFLLETKSLEDGRRRAMARHDLRTIAQLDAQPRGLDYMHYQFFKKTKPGTEASFHLALLAHGLLKAKASGYQVPESLLNRFLDAVASMRGKDGSFGYARPEKDPASGAARSSLCELTLYRAGRSDAGMLFAAARRYLGFREDMRGVLDTNRIWHDKKLHGWAKYYYLFGAHWTARCLAELHRLGYRPAEVRTLANELAGAFLELQEPDGSLTDSPEAGGPNYGSATAILALLELRPILAPKP